MPLSRPSTPSLPALAPRNAPTSPKTKVEASGSQHPTPSENRLPLSMPKPAPSGVTTWTSPPGRPTPVWGRPGTDIYNDAAAHGGIRKRFVNTTTGQTTATFYKLPGVAIHYGPAATGGRRLGLSSPTQTSPAHQPYNYRVSALNNASSEPDDIVGNQLLQKHINSGLKVLTDTADQMNDGQAQWGRAVDNWPSDAETWAFGHFVPPKIQERLFARSAAHPTMRATNAWEKFGDPIKGGGTIAGSVVKVVTGVVPGILAAPGNAIHYLEHPDKNSSIVSHSMGSAPVLVGSLIGAGIRSLDNPVVARKGAAAALNQFFNKDLPNDPVGTGVSLLPFVSPLLHGVPGVSDVHPEIDGDPPNRTLTRSNAEQLARNTQRVTWPSPAATSPPGIPKGGTKDPGASAKAGASDIWNTTWQHEWDPYGLANGESRALTPSNRPTVGSWRDLLGGEPYDRATSGGTKSATSSPIPDSYINPNYTVDMRGAPPSSPRTSKGFPRDYRWFWQQFRDKYPEAISPRNDGLISRDSSPRVDDTWVKYFPTHQGFPGDELRHHHIDQGPIATPMPRLPHEKWTKSLHPYRGVRSKNRNSP